MSFVVLDTEVTSNAFKRRTLPPPIVATILHNRLCITFVTLAELTKWARASLQLRANDVAADMNNVHCGEVFCRLIRIRKRGLDLDNTLVR